MTPDQRLRRIRILLGGFIFGVVISGVTAFPLTWEVNLLVQWFGQGDGGLATWLRTVQAGLQSNDQNYPFIAYGTDWLAFGHLVIAGVFFGPYRDPVKNKFIIQWGMWTCALVPLLAFTCGPIRGIPFGWRIIDSLFGIIGIIPLWLAIRETKIIQSSQTSDAFGHWPVPTKVDMQQRILDGSVAKLMGTIWESQIADHNGFPMSSDCTVTYFFDNCFGKFVDDWGEEEIFMWRLAPNGDLETLDLMRVGAHYEGDRLGQDSVTFLIDEDVAEHTVKVQPDLEWKVTPYEVRIENGKAYMTVRGATKSREYALWLGSGA